MVQSKIAQKRAAYRQSLERALERLIAQFGRIPEIEKVILFGSYARGRSDLFTDLDLLVIMDTQMGFLKRTANLYRQIETDVDLDMLIYTPAEFEENRENAFLRHALKTGKVVYEKRSS